MHLTVDATVRTWGYPWGFERETSQGYLSRWLEAMPERIGMEGIAPPFTIWRDQTLHGFQVIAQSHISVELHMEPKKAFISIFTCKAFDIDKALDIVTRELAMEALVIRRIQRGLEYVTELKT